MNGTPVAMRIRTPLSSPYQSPSSTPRPMGVVPRRPHRHGSFQFLFRLLLPCALPLLMAIQWMMQWNSQQNTASWSGYRSWVSVVDVLAPSEELGTRKTTSSFVPKPEAETTYRIDAPPEAILLQNDSKPSSSAEDNGAASAPLSRFTEAESSQFLTKNSTHPIPVVCLTARRANSTGTLKVSQSCFDDALLRSKYVTLVQEYHYVFESRSWIPSSNVPLLEDSRENDRTIEKPIEEPLVYIVDWASLHRDCHVLERFFGNERIAPRHEIHGESRERATLRWVYYDTTNSARVIACPKVTSFLGVSARITYGKRSIVQGRYWNQTLEWIEPGALIPDIARIDDDGNEAQFTTDDGQDATSTEMALLHVPRTLSDDFVHRLDRLWSAAIKGTRASKGTANSRNREKMISLTSNTFQLPEAFWKDRPIDIGILARNATSLVDYSWFRSHVSRHIEAHASRSNYSLRFLGDPVQAANETIQMETLLTQAKVVILVQPDEWQDTSGMLEAMASGAMVLSDAILEPAFSLSYNISSNTRLVNKTNLLVYDSISSLSKLLDYYLTHDSKRVAIAKKGWEYSMGLQRSWQGLERLLFGSPGTHAGQPYHKAPSRRFRR